jgi:hypothetical protein
MNLTEHNVKSYKINCYDMNGLKSIGFANEPFFTIRVVDKSDEYSVWIVDGTKGHTELYRNKSKCIKIEIIPIYYA